jgi:hypothetical protein
MVVIFKFLFFSSLIIETLLVFARSRLILKNKNKDFKFKIFILGTIKNPDKLEDISKINRLTYFCFFFVYFGAITGFIFISFS